MEPRGYASCEPYFIWKKNGWATERKGVLKQELMLSPFVNFIFKSVADPKLFFSDWSCRVCLDFYNFKGIVCVKVIRDEFSFT